MALGIDISNIVSVQLLKEQRGANYDNINIVAMITTEQGAVLNSRNRYRTYKNLASVKTDFGVLSKTYQKASAFFSTSPNPVSAKGALVIGYWNKTGEDLPAEKYDTITAKNIDKYDLLKRLQDISNGGLNIAGKEAVKLDFTACTDISEIFNVLIKAGLFADITFLNNQITYLGETLNAVKDVEGRDSLITVLGLNGVYTPKAAAMKVKAETAVQALAEVIEQSAAHGATFIDEVDKNQIMDLAAFATANRVLLYHVFSQVEDTTTRGMPWAIAKSGQEYFRCLFSKSNDKAFGVSYMARVHVVNFSAENTAMTMNLKGLACAYDEYSQTELDNTERVGLDVYTILKDVPITLSRGANEFVDNVYNLKAYINAVETDTFNLMHSTPTKIGQTERSINLLVDCVIKTTERFVRAGVFGAGEWTLPDTFGDYEDFFNAIRTKGYYVYAQPLAEQSQTDRVNRESPVIQTAVKNQGAIHKASHIVYFNY